MPIIENSIQLENIFNIKNLIIYIIIINIVGFFIMLIDKKKAEKSKWRIQEKTLLLISVFGGSIGTLVGMYVFHHKTKKARFYIGMPLILIFQIITIIYILCK